jgi:subtilase family serine protease
MNNKFDELAKGLAQSTTRRHSRRLSGFAPNMFDALATTVLASLVLAVGASAQIMPTNLFRNAIHSYTPADICAAYGVDALHNEGWTGKGQTIVIVDPYGSPTALQDLQIFSATFGLSAPNLTIIHPDGQPTMNSNDKLSSVAETSMDLQWAHAIAPDANLVLIAANPSETEGVHGFPSMFKGIQIAISNYPGSPISQSFAATEQAFESPTNSQLLAYEAIYQQALAAGCTPLAAAGDWGTANYTKQAGGNSGSSATPGYYHYPTVNWPASSPYVTAVGGTWLQYHWRWDPQTNFAAYDALTNCGCDPIIDGNNPVSEAFLAWDDTTTRVEAVWREDWLDIYSIITAFSGGVINNVTGGGLSAYFPTPSWQAGLPYSLTQGARVLPDVSWNAAWDGGVLVYCSLARGFEPGIPGWFDGNGTSAATPQIAGLVALVNQIRASVGKGPLGHLAPRLYQLPAGDFNDIVPVTFGSGANAVTVGDNSRFGSGVPGWPCTVGYDLTTGLGSPKAYSFVHDLATMFP